MKSLVVENRNKTPITCLVIEMMYDLLPITLNRDLSFGMIKVKCTTG